LHHAVPALPTRRSSDLTYFFSVVDEADLLAAAEAAGVEQAVCSCSEKCAAGAVNTECAVCSVNMEKCVGVEPEPVETEEPAPEEDRKSTRLNSSHVSIS